jgi:ATP-dependent DNA helicase RecG
LPISDIARRRLETFTATSDGFQIAEADLEMRGPGEMFGVKQSGLPEFRSAKLADDRDLIVAARSLLEYLFTNHDRLDRENQILYMYLNEKASKQKLLLGGG